MFCLQGTDGAVWDDSWPGLTSCWTGRSRSPFGFFPSSCCPVIFPSLALGYTNSDCRVTSSACQPSRRAHTPELRAKCLLCCSSFTRWSAEYLSWLPGKACGERGATYPFCPWWTCISFRALWSHSMSHKHSIMCNTWFLANQPCLRRQMMMWGALLVTSEDCTFIFRRHTSFVGILKDSMHAYSIPGGYFWSWGYQSNRTSSPHESGFYLLNHGYLCNFACCYSFALLQPSELRRVNILLLDICYISLLSLWHRQSTNLILNYSNIKFVSTGIKVS